MKYIRTILATLTFTFPALAFANAETAEVAAAADPVVVDASIEKLVNAAEMSLGTVYLMGFSFILGSLFTILLLLILDFMRSRREPKAS